MNALLIFLVIVIVVTATLVYLYFNNLGPWKKENSPAPAPAQTQVLPSITDFSVDRTLSPDGSSEPYTIEPYTIEPYTAEDILALSKNVTFTLNWNNGIGFEEAEVSKIEVYHGVMTETETVFNDTNWKLRNTFDVETGENVNALKNFATVTTSISGLDGEGAYSFQGNNFFRVVAYYGTGGSSIELYNTEKEKLAIKISSDDLVATLSLAEPETVTYKPRLGSDVGQSLVKQISNQLYDFYYFKNVPQSTETEGELLFENVRLVPVDDFGTQFKLEKGNTYFKVNSETKGYSWFNGVDISETKGDWWSNGVDISDASTVYIAESQETDTRGYDDVILLKVLINNESYYLFGPDMGFKKLTDPSISTADQFFRRNIYIKEVSQT